MKKKNIILIVVIVIFILMLIPIPMRLKDGGSVEYKAILYKYTKIHRLSEQSSTGYENGWELRILRIQIGENINTYVENKYSFKAKIIENDGNHDLLVEIIEDSELFKKGDKVIVKVENYQFLEIYYLKDMRLEVLFNGNINESNPPQISSSSISVLDYSTISMIIKSKTLSSKGATFILKNYTDEEYCYGPEYTIEINENGKWKEIDTLTGKPLVWNSIAYTIKPGEEKEININWSYDYGELKNGEYRLVKKTFKEEKQLINDSKLVHLYAEFNIK